MMAVMTTAPTKLTSTICPQVMALLLLRPPWTDPEPLRERIRRGPPRV